ncbi:hypothetical protein [Rhizobium etli]|uniref:hypothetical protein n=1 Tax=Rhizobium etli TaxID=29449 RepID=UPI0003839702|nr:hypothetical protein [Rhizobium etli]AGS25613.1 hypothetical protein REMIM1_PE00530 [Rhizobium etli bv. mimosae str. Mim1]
MPIAIWLVHTATVLFLAFVVGGALFDPLNGRQVPSFVTMHIMTVRRTKANFPERREGRLAQMPPLEAASLVNEPELKSLFRRVERRALS